MNGAPVLAYLHPFVHGLVRFPLAERLKRYHDFDHDHFVTWSCYHRLPFLNDDHSRTTFLYLLEQVRQRHQFYVYGYVIMPEHVHLLAGGPIIIWAPGARS